ncbi:MAG: hypothetical protein JST00_13375 [Deltaproteobacteria bacterium]|nr:hypothetical protein [Deltaproteobacteria bacterium]
MVRLRSILVVSLLATLTFACNRVRVDDVRGPDGSGWKRISCKHMDPRCYSTAQRMCPNGYFMTYADGESPAAANAEAAGEVEPGAAAAPEVGKNVKQLPPQSRWSHGMYSWSRGTILVKCAGANDHI